MMIPPASAEIVSTPNSEYWFEGDLLCIITKRAPEPPFEVAKKLTDDFKKILGGKKICAVMDFTNASPSSKEVREYNQKHLMDSFKAIAFVSDSVFSRTLAHLFMGFRTLPFPIKVFAHEKQAKEWIQQYI